MKYIIIYLNEGISHYKLTTPELSRGVGVPNVLIETMLIFIYIADLFSHT